MELVHKLFSISVRGCAIGVALAAFSPQERAVADCRCDDFADGAYTCNAAQTKCMAGDEYCVVLCS